MGGRSVRGVLPRNPGVGAVAADRRPVLRVGYDGQNGHAYTGIGKLLRDRDALGPGQATMAGIIDWLRAHPADAPKFSTPTWSKVFFKALTVPADRGRRARSGCR